MDEPILLRVPRQVFVRHLDQARASSGLIAGATSTGAEMPEEADCAEGDTMTRSVSLFGGIGATAKGQRDIVGAVLAGIIELNPTAAETLRLNFDPEIVFEADVSTFDWSTLGRVDVVTGGPPCQPFSQAANGNGEYDKRDCIPYFTAAVAALRPKLFIMEEVRTLTWARHRTYFERVLSDLRNLGYEVAYRVLDMSKYGIPQARKRLFTVGVPLGGEVRWPDESPAPTMAEALGWGPSEATARASLAPNPRPDLADWVYHRPATTVVGSFRPEIQAAPGYRRQGDGPRQNAPGSVYISLAEALVLQGLPRDWQVAGRASQQRLQVGNSCPPQMTAAITLANLGED